MLRTNMSDKFGKALMESAVVCIKKYFQHLPGGTEENYE